MPDTIASTVTLLGPGVESKTAVKNLYVFYRYEMMLYHTYDGDCPTPPADATEETWRSGVWVNRFGVIDGLHSATHDEGIRGEDVF